MCITEDKLVESYGKATPRERFRLIYKNYSIFPQLVDCYETGLFNRILFEVEYNRRKKNDDDLCRRNHITMIRLLEKKYKDFDNCICLTYLGYSLEILDLLIKQLFPLIRIEEDIDLIRDIFDIEKIFHNMVRMY